MGCDVRGSWSQWAEGCIPPLADDGEDRQRSKGALTKANFQIEKKLSSPIILAQMCLKPFDWYRIEWSKV